MKRGGMVFFGLFYSFACFSQAADSLSQDSLFRQSVAVSRVIYFEEIKGNAQFYHGSKYAVEQKRVDGHPFYLSDIMRSGTITYQGILYSPVKLYYDLTSDLLVVGNYAHDDMVTLASDKIDSFSIGSHVFVNFRNKENGLPRKGFYEQIYAGDPGVYARREKKFYFGTGNQESRYAENNYYYIRKKGIFYKVGGKTDMLTVLDDQREAMKNFIHNSRPDFKNNIELAFRQSVQFYSQLKNQ